MAKVVYLSVSLTAKTNTWILYVLQLTPRLSLQLKLHAFLLWSSVGFLMPIGVLLIRVSSNVRSPKTAKALFYCHVASQVLPLNFH